MRSMSIGIIAGVLASFSLALYLRLLPVLTWGYWINEFDPYVRYYLAKRILEHGFLWWFSHEDYTTTQFWYPYGIDWRHVLVPVVSMAGALMYLLFKSLGSSLTLYQVVVLTPAIVNSLSVFSMYYLGSKVGGRATGLVSALCTAVCTGFVQRGVAGWFDDESISLVLIPLGLALFIESITSRRPSLTLAFGALAGVVLGLVVWTWGAFAYLWNLIALYVIVALFLSYYRMSKGHQPLVDLNALSLSYSTFYLVFNAFVLAAPRYGLGTILSATNSLPFAAFVVSLLQVPLRRYLTIGRLETFFRFSWRILAAGLAIFVVLVLLSHVGLLGGLGKYLMTVSPAFREAIVASVAEHSVSSFYDFQMNYPYILPLAAVGIVASFLTSNPGGLLISLYLVTNAYFASSMVRLLVLMAPAVVIASSYGFTILASRVSSEGFESREVGTLRIAVVGVAVVVLSLCLYYSTNNSLAYARAPPQILSTVVPSYVSEDWLDALLWLRTRVPDLTPTASWWDYGYWISVIANKSSVADNSTVNSTQISLIARAFTTTNEDEALYILQNRLRVKYIVLFMPTAHLLNVLSPIFGLQYVVLHEFPQGGDFVKSYWMGRIAGRDESYIFKELMGVATIISGNRIVPVYVPLNLNATIYRMMFSKQILYYYYHQSALKYLWIFEGPITLSVREGAFVLAPSIPSPRYYIGPVPANATDVRVRGLQYINGWVPYVTTEPPHRLRLVYVSKPFGWVTVWKLED